MQYLKTIYILILSFVLTSCSPFLLLKNNKIHEGIGFNNLLIDKTNKSDIIRKFGTSHRDYGGGNYDEIRYDQKGLGFRGKWWADTTSLQVIELNLKKIRGTTDKGLKVNKNTKIKDVIETYGSPKDRYGGEVYIGRYDDGTFDKVEFYVNYPHLGVSFIVNPKLNTIDNAENMTDIELIEITLDVDSFYTNQSINTVVIYKKE